MKAGLFQRSPAFILGRYLFIKTDWRIIFYDYMFVIFNILYTFAQRTIFLIKGDLLLNKKQYKLVVFYKLLCKCLVFSCLA